VVENRYLLLTRGIVCTTMRAVMCCTVIREESRKMGKARENVFQAVVCYFA